MVGYPVIFFVKLDLGILVDCVIVYIFGESGITLMLQRRYAGSTSCSALPAPSSATAASRQSCSSQASWEYFSSCFSAYVVHVGICISYTTLSH